MGWEEGCPHQALVQCLGLFPIDISSSFGCGETEGGSFHGCPRFWPAVPSEAHPLGDHVAVFWLTSFGLAWGLLALRIIMALAQATCGPINSGIPLLSSKEVGNVPPLSG